MRQLRHGAPDGLADSGRRLERREIRFWKVPVVVGLLLGPLGNRLSLGIDPATGFLDENASIRHDGPLTHLLEPQRPLDRSKRVHVLDLDLGTDILTVPRTNGDVGVASECALLHVPGRRADVSEDAPERHQVLARFFRRAKIRLADDLHQGNAGAIEIDQADLPGAIGFVQEPPRILLDMNASDAGASGLPVHLERQCTVHAKGKVVLGDLIALGKVWVHIVLAVELAVVRQRALECQARSQDGLDRGPVDDRQCPRQSQAHRTHMGVGFGVGVIGGTAAIHLAPGQDLSMDLEPNNGLEVRGWGGDHLWKPSGKWTIVPPDRVSCGQGTHQQATFWRDSDGQSLPRTMPYSADWGLWLCYHFAICDGCHNAFPAARASTI